MERKSQTTDIATQARNKLAEEALAHELEVIRELHPDIQTLDDLIRLEGADKLFERLNEGGLSLSEAFVITQFAAISRRKGTAVKESTMRQYAGKEHMSASKQRGGAGVHMPQETKELYKQLFPDLSETEMQHHYAKNR